MKVRIGDQSLRIRISQKEAESLNSGDTLTTFIRLSPIECFEIELRTWNLTIGEVHAEPHKLIASIPLTASQQLAAERGYSFTCEQSAHDHRPLTLEVEIDLQKERTI